MNRIPPILQAAAPGIVSPSLEQLDAAARAADLADRMRACLDDLDDLGLWRAGAYLDQAISALEYKG